MLPNPPAQPFRPPPMRALMLGLGLSLALHGLVLVLGRPAPQVSANPPLRLVLARPVAAKPVASATAPATRAQAHAPLRAQGRAQARAQDRAQAGAQTKQWESGDAAPGALSPPPPDSKDPAPDGQVRPSAADIMAAARREAVATAHALNQAPGAGRAFRSAATEELDRQFDAAHAAGGSWFRSARVEEITRASDGNARVYRIVTPFGAFCRSHPANGGQPMNMLCPR